MRLWQCLLLPLVAGQGLNQQPIVVKPTSVNLVDQLGNDPDFTLLLRVLQRTRLIPTLNRIPNATLFAPTNDAIERYRNSSKSLSSQLWDPSDSVWSTAPDNVQYQLRQHLLYHLINHSLPIMPSEFPSSHPLTLDTLHFPDEPLEPPTDEPAPAPPWLPVPGGLLNNAPQRLRVASRDDSAWAGVDYRGQGGVQVTKSPVSAVNGIIIPINDIVPIPGNLYEEISAHPLLTELKSIMTPEMKDTLSTAPHLTLFAPVDPAWSALDDIERKYLHSGYAERDVGKLVSLHTSGAGADSEGNVGWSDTWKDGTTFTTAEGQKLRIGFTANGTVQVEQSIVVEQDIYASNGVLHVVSSLLIQSDTFKINAEKYLLALNGTTFVSLLRGANLSHYVDDEHDGQKWTILAPRDDIIMKSTSSLARATNQNESESTLERILRYHFIPGKLLAADLVDGALLGTELREDGLEGRRQRLAVSVASKGKIEPEANGEVGFGNARVISDPIETDNFIVYMLSQVLEPPKDVISRIETAAHLSTYLASVYASKMKTWVQSTPSTTHLVPQNQGFDNLGLITSYLLLNEGDSRKDLKAVLKHHALAKVAYSTDLTNVTTPVEIKTREGSSIIIESSSTGALMVRESGSWNRTSVIHPKDQLTTTGVVHELDDVLLPSSVQISIGDLIDAAEGATMKSLIIRAGLGGILNGTLTLEDIDDLDDWKRTHPRPTRKSRKGLLPIPSSPSKVGWTLLCPKDSAFNRVNLTRLLDDVEALRSLVLQHIIPIPPSPSPPSGSISALSPEVPISYEDKAKYTTLLSPTSLRADLVFRVTPPKPGKGSPIGRPDILVGIHGARGTDGETDYARVLNYGRTTTLDYVDPQTGLTARSGVLQIDTVLEPWVPDWWNAWGKQVSGGGVGVVAIVGFWVVVLYFWRRHEDEATYEPLDGGDD